jgi:TRAP-type mannitol/chloroaromatic compound transport system substrate-binding protein
MTESFKQSIALYSELSARNANWRKVYADYARFRSDQNLWFRFTEASFDRFMQAQRL